MSVDDVSKAQHYSKQLSARKASERYTWVVSLFKSASIVSLLTLLSRITGMLRELLIASLFGASALTDAFNVAFRIPNLFRRLFAEGAFSQAFVPVLASTLAEKGEEETRRLITEVALILSVTLLVVSFLGVLSSPVLVWLMASGFQHNAQSMDLAVQMTRFMFPYIAFMSLVALAAGVLNTWKKFAVPAATPVLLNVCMIVCAYLGSPWLEQWGLPGIYALVLGVMLGGVLQLSVQLWALKSMGLLPKIWILPMGLWHALKGAWASEGTQKILRLMGPSLLGVSVAQLSLLINTQIASHMVSGSVSWLSYADRLMEFPTALLGVALGVVLTPQLSQAKASQDLAQYSALLDWGLKWVMVLTLPCSVALLVFTKPVVSVLYHYGAFTAHDVSQTTLALMGYGLGLMGLVAIKVLAPGFYAAQDTKTPVRIALVVLVLTQVMNLIWVPMFAHAGLALSIGMGALLNATLLWYFLKSSGRYQPQPGWAKLATQSLVAASLMGCFLYWASAHWDWVALRENALSRIALLAGLMAFGMCIYAGVMWLLGFRIQRLLTPEKNSIPTP